jgi:hypothetical protein
MYFRYIDPIRDKNGKLRDWKDYNSIAVNEENIDRSKFMQPKGYFEYKDKILNEKRG